MCGIFGVINGKPAAEALLTGLARLEYRGYDSAGIATVEDDGIACRHAVGRIGNLARVVRNGPPDGTLGIAHTRWATHGAPTEANAHPHRSTRVAVVHNGIVENHRDLRERLAACGRVVESETDTAVIPWLIEQELDRGLTPADAVRAATRHLEGSFALGVLFADRKDLMIAARRGSPLAVGLGDGEAFIASDITALGGFVDRALLLEDGDVAEVTRQGVRVVRLDGHAAQRAAVAVPADAWTEALEGVTHMEREIAQQPVVVERLIKATADLPALAAALPLAATRIARITLIGCGTSYNAGLIARSWFERMAGIPTQCEVASEFRYRDAPAVQGELAILISQSGETADTLACLRLLKQQSVPTLALVNQPGSSMTREADAALPLMAGAEISVASTKAFTAQLTLLAQIARAIASARSRQPADGLEMLPDLMRAVLAQSDHFTAAAAHLDHATSAVFVGRGTQSAVAAEGALKLKEVSYIHAEGFAAGELKHGPIALLAPEVPVIGIAVDDGLLDKTVSNLEEAAARGAPILLVADPEGFRRAGHLASAILAVPSCPPAFAALLTALPLQLLAASAARRRGLDPDRPRNLAKSVTVE